LQSLSVHYYNHVMADVKWAGARAPSPLARELREAGYDLADSAAGDATPTIVFTASGRTPATEAEPGTWIWVSSGAVDDRRRRQAVLRGAYAVISLREPGAAGALIARLRELRTTEPEPTVPPHVVTISDASRRLVRQIARVAPTAMPVLITGETGTGKEVAARLLHAWSPRHQKRFVPINCAAIPDELMEAELFGYARGAFSGAVQGYEGQLMAGAGGTVFLDEIDDTPLPTQTKLLRVLEDRVVSRLGENVWHEIDFRLLAATNRDLRPLIQAGLFGADLYERLAIVTIHLLPLRERPEDLPALAQHFMQRFAREQARPEVTTIAADALNTLLAYPWPGNIRELRNVIYETLVYKRAGDQLLLSDLPKRILTRGTPDPDATIDRSAVSRKVERGAMNLKAEVMMLQRVAIEEALKRTGGNAAQAARLLGEVGRGVARDPGGTLRAMMRRLGES
jgi:DNA-binding NtrC family response regulator